MLAGAGRELTDPHQRVAQGAGWAGIRFIRPHSPASHLAGCWLQVVYKVLCAVSVLCSSHAGFTGPS